MEAFKNYLNQVRNITGRDSPSFYEVIKNEFELQLNTISPRNVRGIIVGFLYSNDDITSGNLFLSTGRRPSSVSSTLKTKMINEILSLQANQNILFLRTPMISVQQDHKIKGKLIRAFEPVVFEILKAILKSSSNGYENQIPILCLGINSYICISNCLQFLRRPKFVIISSVHPNNIDDMDFQITRAISNSEKKRLEERKYYNIDMFYQAVDVFYLLTK